MSALDALWGKVLEIHRNKSFKTEFHRNEDGESVTLWFNDRIYDIGYYQDLEDGPDYAEIQDCGFVHYCYDITDGTDSPNYTLPEVGQLLEKLWNV